jgi:hypothetical protein
MDPKVRLNIGCGISHKFPSFAITVDSYILLDHTDISKCSSEAHALCPADFVFFSASHQYCLAAALFLGRNEETMELCNAESWGVTITSLIQATRQEFLDI